MKKRWPAIVVLLFAATFLPACTSSSPDCTRPEIVCVGLVTDVGKVDDHSFNQSAWEGVQQAEGEGLVRLAHYIESMDARDYDENIAAFANAGYDMIVTVGSALSQATTAAAEEYPQVYFIGVDQFQEAGAEKPNLAGLVFPEDQAGFLAGALAAQMTATGKVGAVLGADAYPPVWRYGEGFHAGARYINPEIEVTVAYHNDADLDEASFDPDWGAMTAYTMIDEGVDVLFGGSGTTGGGAVVAAVQRGIYAIGAEMDQYYLQPEAAPLLLSSAVKLVSPGTFELIKLAIDVQAGMGAFAGGNYSGKCSYAPFHDLDSQVPAEVKARMEEINQGLHEDTIKTEVPPTKP
jgi:basic membrane protein A